MSFKIPVVLLLFKRTDTLPRIIERIKSVKPEKIYFLADGPRNEEEKNATDNCRKVAENLIDWPCEVIKHYAEKNVGVYNNIGEGAKWVFEQEEVAIFLEDDNLPETSFFQYCSEMLNKYKDNDKVLWICGTNYLGDESKENKYYFTQHLLPCGWASWGNKFNKYYDGYLTQIDNPEMYKRFKDSYLNKALYTQQDYSVKRTKHKIDTNVNTASWDFQMLYTVRANGMYGIAPSKNQIVNIGVDENSIHGGTSMKSEMTRRFCGMKSAALEFPLEDPKDISIDSDFENKIGNIILPPLSTRIMHNLAQLIKKPLGMNQNDSFLEKLKGIK